jgi:hypothetical protein
MKATQASIRESLAVGKGSKVRGVTIQPSLPDGQYSLERSASGNPAILWYIRLVFLTKKPAAVYHLTRKRPSLTTDQSFSSEDDRLQMWSRKNSTIGRYPEKTTADG